MRTTPCKIDATCIYLMPKSFIQDDSSKAKFQHGDLRKSIKILNSSNLSENLHHIELDNFHCFVSSANAVGYGEVVLMVMMKESASLFVDDDIAASILNVVSRDRIDKRNGHSHQ